MPDDDSTTALPQTCVRCGNPALVRIVGRCAGCIGELGLADGPDYQAFKGEVRAEFGVKG
jgi:hypothetical protein